MSVDLTPEQNALLERAQSRPEALSVGATWDDAMAAMRRDFWGIVTGHLLGHLLLVVGSGLTLGLAAPALVVGLIRFHQRKLRGEPADLGVLLSGFPDFGRSLGLALILIVLTAVGYLCCILPGIYLAVAWSLSFFLLAAADPRQDIWGLMEVSRRATGGRWFQALLLLLVIHLVAYAGLVACLVGALVTAPFALLMACSAHDRLFRP